MSILKKIQDTVASVLGREPSIRQDAAFDTAFLARDLTQIESEMYRIEYPDILWRQFIPVKNSGLNPGAKYFVYKIWDYFTNAKFISSYADDLPNVALRASEQVSSVQSLGNSYQFSAVDLMQASMAGIALEREEAAAAFEGIERKIEDVAAFGAPEVGMQGWAKHSDVSISSPAANGGGGSSTYFVDKTPAQILADLNGFVFEMRNRAKQKGTFTPNEMVMPPSLYGFLATKPVSDLQPSVTVLSVFTAMNPYVKSVREWDKLETAGETGGPRIVLSNSSPRNGEFYIPMEAKAEPPQDRNLSVVVNVWARIGGFVLRQPLAYMYIDAAGPVPS